MKTYDILNVNWKKYSFCSFPEDAMGEILKILLSVEFPRLVKLLMIFFPCARCSVRVREDLGVIDIVL